jgi:hypothetical protein
MRRLLAPFNGKKQTLYAFGATSRGWTTCGGLDRMATTSRPAPPPNAVSPKIGVKYKY